MNGAELHLAINHLPIAATLFGLFILLGGLIFSNNSVKKVGLILLIFAGLSTIPTLKSGEKAEEIIENMAYGEDVHHTIHEHEELAETAQWISLGVSLLALLAFYFHQTKKAPAHFFTIIAFLGSIGSLIYFIEVADSGGKISHPEMREDFVVPSETDEVDNHPLSAVFTKSSILTHNS